MTNQALENKAPIQWRVELPAADTHESGRDEMKPANARTLQIINDLGLHARSAAKLAKLAGEAHGGVWIIKNGDTADATSMLDILTLNCPKGTKITVTVDDDDDRNTLELIAALIRSGFGE